MRALYGVRPSANARSLDRPSSNRLLSMAVLLDLSNANSKPPGHDMFHFMDGAQRPINSRTVSKPWNPFLPRILVAHNDIGV